MAKKYLGFVVVYNLLEKDTDEKKEEIEGAINDSISSVLDRRFQADEGNMIYSFPLEPGLASFDIPVVVHMTFWEQIGISCSNGDKVADTIRENLKQSALRERGDVLVRVLTPSLATSVSPRRNH